MKLTEVNMQTVSLAQAKRLLGPANRAEQAAAARWDKSDSAEDKAAWDAALKLEEDLRVFVYAGERPK